MYHMFLNPIVCFAMVFGFLAFMSWVFSKVAFKSDAKAAGFGKAYACGEDLPHHLAQPDYSQFFPYAFFFTIAHVAVLMVATVPMETERIFLMAVIYIFTIVVSLYILFRK
ncbi:MAG: hypothetical protein HQL28_06755 [Candidatus Omnitrophica bacterium]|nr:hypothetical protein [Candidatus Omnitrophota bacterium]